MGERSADCCVKKVDSEDGQGRRVGRTLIRRLARRHSEIKATRSILLIRGARDAAMHP